MGPLLKPRALKAGDEVAVVTPSMAAAHEHPGVFDAGLETLTQTLGLRVRESPTTRGAAEISAEERARDVMAAVRDPAIAGIVASIGGDDALRMLPHLDLDAIAQHPKVMLGFGGATTLLLAWAAAGVVSFHGPNVMSGLAQASSCPPSFLEQLRAVLFDADMHAYSAFPWWSHSYPRWEDDPSNAVAVGTKYSRDPLRVVQGSGSVTAPVFGGRVDVVAGLLGTAVFPKLDGAFLFVDLGSGPPRPRALLRLLWNLEAQGVLGTLAGVLVGRPCGHRPDQRATLEQSLKGLVAADVPIATGLDAGRTTPQIVLPFGIPVTLDCSARALKLAQPAVSPPTR